MFGKKKSGIEYNPEEKQPAVKTSICTGEMVAGFIDLKSRHFEDYTLVKDQSELKEFCDRCGINISDLKKIV